MTSVLTSRRRRPRATYTLAPDVLTALRLQSEAGDVPMSRLVDVALRAWLKLPDPFAKPRAA